jgi:hypothetical protein
LALQRVARQMLGFVNNQQSLAARHLVDNALGARSDRIFHHLEHLTELLDHAEH